MRAEPVPASHRPGREEGGEEESEKSSKIYIELATDSTHRIDPIDHLFIYCPHTCFRDSSMSPVIQAHVTTESQPANAYLFLHSITYTEIAELSCAVIVTND